MGKSENNNIVRMSEFSRLCGVTRGAISQCVAKNKIILTADKKIDLDNPVNKSFLRCHSHGATTATKTTKPEKKKPVIKPADKKTATKKTTQNKQSKPTAKQPTKKQATQKEQDTPDTHDIDIDKMDLMRDLENAIKAGDKEAEEKTQTIIDRAYYESLKIKNDAELKAISIDQKNGTLAEREIIEGLVLELNKTTQEQFFNCVVKQSVEICARLGKVGFEQDVQDVLATDNSRRIHEVKRVTARFLWDRYIKPNTGGQNPYLVDTEDGGAEE